MRNPELFDICATLALSDAYESFPAPKDFNYQAMHVRIVSNFKEDDFDESFKAYLIIQHCFKWLEQFGYICSDGIRNDFASNVLLTEKGLKALRSVPASIDLDRRTVADVLAEAGREGTKEAVLKGIGALFGGFASAI